MTQQLKNTLLFAAFLLLGGALHVAEDYCHNVPSPDYSVVTFLFCLVFMIYSALLVYWIRSVYVRLLPSRSRSYLIIMAILMILYLCLRAVKYRIASEAFMVRLTWYAYYVPMLMIPTLFLMVCVRIGRGERSVKPGGDDRKERSVKPDERLWVIPAVILTALILTNDLHHLVFMPKNDALVFLGKAGTYVYRIPFYLAYGWMILMLLIGIGLLVRTCGKGKDKKKLLYLVGIGALWFFLIELHSLKARVEFIPPYETPEIHVFCMLAVFEFCIRERLIPHNENYAGFFAKLPMPVVITDRKFQVVYQSANGIEADGKTLREALTAPLYPVQDQKLSGKKIRGGYAFWIVDESEVRRANDALLEANEILESENTLIDYENKQKEQNAYYQSRHHIYHEIAEKMYPCQKRIEEALGEMHPSEADFRDRIAFISVLNAYVKRKTNLLLLASEEEGICLKELFLAISESGRYLSYVGIKTSVDESGFREEKTAEAGKAAFGALSIIALYDCFEFLAEQMIGSATLLMVSLSGAELKLATDVRTTIHAFGTELPVTIKESEGITYLTVRAGKGGD